MDRKNICFISFSRKLKVQRCEYLSCHGHELYMDQDFKFML